MFCKNLDVLFIVRGRPGLGHVTPSIAVAEQLKNVNYAFVSYDLGSSLIRKKNMKLFDVRGPPLGQRICPFFEFLECKETLWPIVKETSPKLVVVDGEYYFPLICKQNNIKSIIIASQHYVEGKLGKYKRYSDIIQILFNPAEKIFCHGVLEPDNAIVDSEFVGPVVCNYKQQKIENIITVTSGGGNLEHFKPNNNSVFELIKNIKNFNMKFEVFGGPSGNFAENLLENFSKSRAVIARSGLSTVEELTYMGKPSIFLAPANDDEKIANAQLAEKAGVGIKMIEEDVTEENLVDNINKVLKMKPKPLKSNGANKIAKYIEEML